MTENEKLIWAAAYASEWTRQYGRQGTTNTTMYIPTCIENAWAAVTEARENVAAVEEGWGKDHEVTTMLKEMVQP